MIQVIMGIVLIDVWVLLIPPPSAAVSAVTARLPNRVRCGSQLAHFWSFVDEEVSSWHPLAICLN